ncbi:MAG: M1 family metallopeptidase [Anaerolineae bacterium]|nr:M1 family metallopeptidase [Anaerolineae bacterium]
MPHKLTKRILLICLFLLFILACNPANTTPVSPDPPAAAVSPTPSPPPTSSPAPTPIPSPAPTTAAPIVPADIIPPPKFNFDDLAPYRQAMRPNFAADVETVARAGATRYYLEVSLDPAGFADETGLTLNGVAQIYYTNTENKTLSEIYFRLYPNLPAYGGQMAVDAIAVNGQSVTPTLKAENSALVVPLAQPLPPGETITINLTYQAMVPTQPMFGYNIFIYNEHTVTLAGFYPALAVYDETGWDVAVPPPYGDATYLDVSLYQVKLNVPQEMVVAASGSLLNAQNNPDGSKTLTLVSGPMRDFYIAMRDDYEIVSKTVDGITVNSYYPPQLENGGQSALRYAANSLRVFNERFGPYPYAEFDIVATPTTAGGVEYPGIVVINQQLYEFEGPFFRQAVSHEVAHQWWYGLVGNDQIEEPWLDEALTNYSTVFYWQEVEGEKMAERVIEGYFLTPYETAVEMGEDRAVLGPVGDFSERDYGIFVYGKGPLFFHALRREVGDDVYLKIMQTYCTNYKYKIAQANDLLATIEQVSGQNIDSLFETWLQKSKNQPNRSATANR